MAKRYNKENGRKCMRLRGYDYSREGLYFITIMVQKRLHLFGEIKNGQMILNHAGEMVHEWYYEIENKFPDKRCHAMVVMPNHFHCIIENTKCDAHDEWDAHVDSCFETPNNNHNDPHCGEKYNKQNQIYNAGIERAMDWFKTMTTNAYIRGVKNENWRRFDRKLWQRSCHDRIIRNEEAYQNISKYIFNNPASWQEDGGNEKLKCI